jgi:hypothetical protein
MYLVMLDAATDPCPIDNELPDGVLLAATSADQKEPFH